MAETGMAMMGTGIGTGEGRARVAAEAAVSSPLLENIDLAGAHGILVNVTAGMDLSIGEFQEVGTIVKQFASEDATVVVGTVIDPEMSGELRVTVVATGLNRAASNVRHREVPHQVPAHGHAQQQRGNEPSMRVVPRSRQPSATDYNAYDKPAVQRFQRAVGDGSPAAPMSEELLDIPAFLRRQAD
jgi:cell division protein FtsZ